MNIIEIAKECGAVTDAIYEGEDAYLFDKEELQAFADRIAEIARQEQREKDSGLADIHAGTAHTRGNSEEFIALAAAIRKGDV